MTVYCRYCRNPLPKTRRWTQFYHVGRCQRLGHNRVSNRAYHARKEARIQSLRSKWKVDPMKLLHLDFALDRLKKEKT
jgi:hypothetical protein